MKTRELTIRQSIAKLTGDFRLPLVVASLLAPSIGTAGAQDLSVQLPADLSAADWACIRQAHDAFRHAAYPVPGGYSARNPGQQLEIHFDGRGFTAIPDAGEWTWGLELLRYGFAGQDRAVGLPLRTNAHGERVAYDWDELLQEWYVSDARGLEHGYTLHQRPSQPEGGDEQAPLTFTLQVRGGLAPAVDEDRRGVRFLDGSGRAVLTYSGLTVLDAEGRALPASLEHVAAGLLLTVDDRDACFPLTIDPIVQQAYLKASNTEAYDRFGREVAVSGDTVVVAAPEEDSNATGVNGDQSNNDAQNSGAAYVFVRNGTSWSQQAYLKASNTGAGDAFGVRVSVSEDTVVVAASAEDSNATGVNGDQSNNDAENSGAAYVFVRSGTSWSQQAYLKASNTDAADFFGKSVSVSGDTVVVGAIGEDSATGDQNNNDIGSGAAYVFVRSGASWSQQAYLKASNPGHLDDFGWSASVSGDTLVVGAVYEDSDATGVNGDQTNDNAEGSGAAYVFARTGTDWSQQAYLKASNTEGKDFFGFAVSVSGDTVLVGAPNEDSDATGSNGNQSSNSTLGSGAAYIFVRSGASWSQEAYLKASNPDEFDAFGRSVAVSGETVVVGAYKEDSSASGVNGDQSDNSTLGSGAAYVFERSASNWGQRAYLKASNTGEYDHYGLAVAVSDGTVVVGAYREDSNATGVNGDQSDNSAIHSGAAYVFGVPFSFPIGTNYCGPAVPNSSGNSAVIAGLGSDRVADNCVWLAGTGLPPNQYGYFLTSRTQGFIANPGGSVGNLCLALPIGRFSALVQDSGSSGEFAIPVDLTSLPVAPPIPVRVGETWHFQAWFRDVGNTSNFTDGVAITFM